MEAYWPEPAHDRSSSLIGRAAGSPDQLCMTRGSGLCLYLDKPRLGQRCHVDREIRRMEVYGQDSVGSNLTPPPDPNRPISNPTVGPEIRPMSEAGVEQNLEAVGKAMENTNEAEASERQNVSSYQRWRSRWTRS